MYNRINARNPADLLLPMHQRGNAPGVYFARLCQWSTDIRDFLWRYHEAARANPDERQLTYLTEMLGSAFEPNPAFITQALQKWMPRMSQQNRVSFADALCTQLEELKRKGKTDSIIRNIYMKVMCWLYHKFERLMPFLGEDNPPRILYECQAITAHELILLRILSMMGTDILLLEPQGDAAYLKQDAASAWSQLLTVQGAPIAKDFTLKQFRREMAMAAAGNMRQPSPAVPRPVTPPMPTRSATTAVPPQIARTPAPVTRPPVPPQRRDPETYFPKPSRMACTNAWMKEAAYEEILTPIAERGDDFRLFYHAFIRVKGVPDKQTYISDLFQFYQKFRSTGRRIAIVDDGLSLPGAEEAAQIRRHPYRSQEELIIDIAGNLPACANVELQRLMQQAFVRTMLAAAKHEPNLNRLVISAVYLLCWIQQYQAALFQGYKGSEIPCFVLMGGCRNQHDALFVQYLAQLPVDILILACDLSRPCTLQSPQLLELTGKDSMPVPKFPRDGGSVQMRTMASNAEQDLTSILYTDSGIYRNRQFSRADAITLQTTYDEVFILWSQELKYRANFSTVNQVVNMPVVYAKISGVEDGKVEAYWQKIKLLLGDDTMLIPALPYVVTGTANQFQPLAVKTLRNGRLKREDIKADRQFPFALLREELQEHMFDKVQLMLDERMIKGTFVNGTEYTVLATVLNMNRDIVRRLQSFDFTKKNPKMVVLCTGEQPCSLEDAILLTFLNLVGFDIALFVPTGYQTIERYLNGNYPVEHQSGEYVYDLQVPDFNALTPVKRSWLENILKRGN